MTGGGTGGHITPLLAVAHELKRQAPSVRLTYVGERRGKFQHLTLTNDDLDDKRYIFAGKFRRYHGESWLRRLFDVRTNLLNARDGIYVLIGFGQVFWYLLRHRPDVVFVKGGFVGVPVGLVSALLRIPFVTHDSDTSPGLANYIISRWAIYNATGMPTSFYNYPEHKMVHTGIPLSEQYQPVDQVQLEDYRRQLGLPVEAKILLITGGSLGARTLNSLAAVAVKKLLQTYPDLYVFHQTGENQKELYNELKPKAKQRLKVFGFANDMVLYSGAADVIVARGSATYIAEFATQSKAVVMIPHPGLKHQLENAEHLEGSGAVRVMFEKDLKRDDSLLTRELEQLLTDSEARQRLAMHLSAINKTAAAEELAALLLRIKR